MELSRKEYFSVLHSISRDDFVLADQDTMWFKITAERIGNIGTPKKNFIHVVSKVKYIQTILYKCIVFVFILNGESLK